MSFTYDWNVRFGDCDPAGIVYYPVLFRAVHDGMDALMETVDLPLSHIRSEHGIALPIVHASADYMAPIQHGDTVTFAYAVDIGNSSIAFNVEGTRNGEVVCEALEKHVVVDVGSFETMQVPDHVEERFEKYTR